MSVIPPMAGKLKKGQLRSRLAWIKNETLSPKQPDQKGGMAQAVQCLPSKHKTLNSKPSITKQANTQQKH
jgi:hypothetical protein